MQNRLAKLSAFALSTATAFGILVYSTPQTIAQNQQLEQRLQEIKQASAANKQALSHYTWQEQQTISLKGEVKKTQLFQVSLGPDGQQQKNELNASPAAQPSGGRVRRRIVEKKKEEFQEYGQQIAALAKQYAQPDPQALQQAYQQGNISIKPGGDEGTVSLIVKSYKKPNDSVTLVFNRQQKAMESVNVSTYMNDPTDAVTVAVQFAKLPSGPNHVASMQVNGVSKQLGVSIQNSNYRPI
jgi:hypothetical protein